VPQLVRWNPVDGGAAGIRVVSRNDPSERFVPWTDLHMELSRLLLQLFDNPAGFHFVLQDYHGKADWLMWIADETGERYCDVWMGVNPAAAWEWDGLVHFGDVDDEHQPVWQSYQRYSDGTYRCLPSTYHSLDDPRRTRGIGIKR
jgi:hypothetical protein